MRTEVVTALIEAEIPKEEIEGIEASRKDKYFVVLKSYAGRRNMGKSIKIRERNLEMVLRHYGSFTEGSIRDLEDRNCGIKNGIKQVYMHVKKAIPSYIHIGKNQVRVDYEGQTATCRKCHTTGHIGRKCEEAVTCRKCGATDHNNAECSNVICFRCGEQGHTANSCIKYYEDYPDLHTYEVETTENNPNPFKTIGAWEEPNLSDEHNDDDETNKMEHDATDAKETVTKSSDEKEKDKENKNKGNETTREKNEETATTNSAEHNVNNENPDKAKGQEIDTQ